jgi:hypothetical protein
MEFAARASRTPLLVPNNARRYFETASLALAVSALTVLLSGLVGPDYTAAGEINGFPQWSN